MARKKTNPVWWKSFLQNLGMDEMIDELQIIVDDGDPYGFESECENDYASKKDSYFWEYEQLFAELAGGAENMIEKVSGFEAEASGEYMQWDDVVVSILGDITPVQGYDELAWEAVDLDERDEERAQDAATERICKLKKEGMVELISKMMTTLLQYIDLKCAHDTLIAVIDELDEKGAILERKIQEVNRAYEDLGVVDDNKIDEVVGTISPYSRLWVE